MVSSQCVSRYCDFFSTETKELSVFFALFFVLLFFRLSPCLFCLVDDMRVDKKEIAVISLGVGVVYVVS